MGAKDHAGQPREVAPEVLRGDPEQTRELIDSLSFKRKYTSGVLSFSEANIDPVQKQHIMESWEYTLFPGMHKNQYSILWVEHRDKGRLELNFVIPNVELQTGKRLQPYFDKADRNRVDAWQTLVNSTYGFTDPHEPDRAMTLAPTKNLPKDRQEAAETITNGLLTLGVESRAEIIEALSKAGLEVVRQTKSSISIKDPEGGKNLRLKGALYAEDYRGGNELRTTREEAERSYRESRESRIREARSRFERGIEIRRDFLAKRYKPTQTQALDARSIERASIDRVNHTFNTSNERSLELVRVRERTPTSNTDHYGQRDNMAALPEYADRQRYQALLSDNEVSHEPDPVRENAIKFAEEAGRRAEQSKRHCELIRERAEQSKRHFELIRARADQRKSIYDAAAKPNPSFGRIIDAIDEIARAFVRAVVSTGESIERRVRAANKKSHQSGMSPWN